MKSIAGCNLQTLAQSYFISRFFYFFTVFSDMLMVYLALLTAVNVREWISQNGFARGPAGGFEYTYFWYILIYFWLGILLLLYFFDLYRDRRFLTGNREAGRIIKSLLIFMVINMLLAYLLPTFIFFSRLSLLIFLCVCGLGIILARKVVARVRIAVRYQGLDTCNVLIVGNNKAAYSLAQELLDTCTHGYRLLGFIDPAGGKGRLEGIRVFAGLEQLQRVVQRLKIAEVFICEPNWQAREVVDIFLRLRLFKVRIRLVTRIYDSVIDKVGVPVDYLGETPILDFEESSETRLYWHCKRYLDLVISGLVLIILSPLFGLITVAICFYSGRPIFYQQKRVGKNGAVFTCHKFSTMVRGAEDKQQDLAQFNESKGPMFKIQNDPRVTQIGRFLRKYSLDELPQLWNVLKGEMSLLGPHPPLVLEVREYEDWHNKRLLQPMGMTGLWQVSGRNNLSFEEMVLLDIYYNRNASMFMDLRISIKTVFVVLLGQGC